jgi:hypothetical protein
MNGRLYVISVTGVSRAFMKNYCYYMIVIYFNGKKVSTPWQWYYNKAQRNNIIKTTNHAQKIHSTQNIINNKGPTTHTE